MPLFEITHPDGRRFTIKGDRTPTEEDFKAIIQSIEAQSAEPANPKPTRDEIAADVEAKTAAAAPSDTWTKATSAMAGSAVRAATDPIIGAANILRNSGLPNWAIGGSIRQLGTAGEILSPLISAGSAAEEVAKATPGNETLSDVGAAVGSGLGSMPSALVPGVGPVLSATSAGLQSYEQTRREAYETFLAAGIPEDEADKSAHRVALGAGAITGAVTGAFNAWGERIGLGRGVERALGDPVRKAIGDELKRSALRPMVETFLREAGGEATEEAVDQALQEGLVRWQYDKTQTLADSVRQVVKAGALGGVAGGVIGGIPAAAGVVGKQREAVSNIRQGATAPPGLEAQPPVIAPDQPQGNARQPAIPPQLGSGIEEQKAPGTWVYATTPDGKVVQAHNPANLGDSQATLDYISRALPGATVQRIEFVEDFSKPAETRSTPVTPEPDKETPADGVPPAPAAPAGEVAPAEPQPQPKPEPNQATNEAQDQGQVQNEEVLTAPATQPVRKPNPGLDAIRSIEADRPPDFLDWLEANVGQIKSKSKASEATRPFYDVNFEAASAGSNRNAFGADGTEIDVVAQQAFDEQQIRDASPDAVWEAMLAARRGRDAYRRQARAQLADAREMGQQGERFERAAIQGKRDGRLPNRSVDDVSVGDLMPGDEFMVAGEKVTVRRFVFDPETDEMTAVELDDGRKFGTQVVSDGTVIKVDRGSMVPPEAQQRESVRETDDAPFSLRNQPDDFFSRPESVEEQKARLAREDAQRKAQDDRQKMLDRQAAPIIGRPVDTTGDMFDPTAGDAPLFQQPAKRPVPSKQPSQQESLFSTRAPSPRQMSVEQVQGFLTKAFRGKIPERVVVSPDARKTSAGAVIEGAYDSQQDRIILYAPNLRGEADVRRVLRHELLHDVYQDPKVQENWRALRWWLTQGDVDRARREGYGPKSSQEEAVLDIAEARVSRKEGRFRRWVNSIVDAVNRKGAGDWVGAVLGVDRMADSDARLLVQYAERLDRAAKPRKAGAAPNGGERLSIGGVDDGGQQQEGGANEGSGEREGTGADSEKGGRTATDTLRAAAAFIVGGSEAPARDGDAGRDKAPDQVSKLIRWARANGRVVSRSILPRAFDHHGVEHHVWFSGNRVWKVTKPNAFGMSVRGQAGPSEYLERMALQNEVFGDSVRLEGVITQGGVSIVVSQPYIEGRYTTLPEILDWMISEGFQPLTIDGNRAFYRRADNSLVMDAHGKNVLATNRGLVPIDVVMARPEGDLLKEVLRALGIEDSSPPVDDGERFSLRSVATDPAAMREEQERQKTAGKIVTPALSELIHSGVEVAAELGGAPDFGPWSKAMAEKHGDGVRPLLRAAWDRLDDLRFSLQNGIPPESVADINRILKAGDAAPDLSAQQPTPVYDPEKTAKWWMRVVRPSDVIRYFGGDELLKKRGEMEIATAYQSAAVQRQAETLRSQLEDSFYGDHANPILRTLRRFLPRQRLRRFIRLALPIAAHLNVTGGQPGAFQFDDFEMRAGFMPESQASRQGITTGAQIWRDNPVTGELETLTLGPRVELDSGQKGFQLLRPMPATRQQIVYEWARNEFPEFEWFLNTFIDPRLKDTRITVGGVEVPVFNRFALAARYSEGDPEFLSRPAYTPEVSIGMGLVRRYIRARKVTFREGTRSPGRKYETGTAREAMNVLDLLSGFNVRAMQVLQEETRKKWMQDVFSAATEVPAEGRPAGWTTIENAMSRVWEAVQTMRKFQGDEFPETQARLSDDDSPAYRKFWGEVMRLKKSDRELMLPDPVVEAILGDFQVTQELSFAQKIIQTIASNWKAFLLLMPDTFIENRTDNYLRLLMQAHRQLVLAAIRGGDRLAFREAKRLAWTSLVNIVPGMRQVFGLNSEALFRKVAQDVLPDEIFSGQTRMKDLWIERGRTEEEVSSLLDSGQRLKAAGKVAANLGPLILEKTGYGNIDVRAKQQFAFSILLAKAEETAWRKGLRGGVRDKFIEHWMTHPPKKDLLRAVDGASRLLLNYSDAPGWLSTFARVPIFNTLVAFPMFRYHWVGREIDRATSALRAAHRLLIRKKKLTREEWAASLADTISYVTLPVMGYTAAKVAGALSDSLIGGLGDDDDKDDPRELVGASSVFEQTEDGGTRRKPLARELVTANRLNVSRLLRMAGVQLDGEQDYWWHIKDYPLIRSTALMYLAAEDARAHGPTAGSITLMRGMQDMLSSLTGVGQAIKVPAKVLAEIEAQDSGKPVMTSVDPYATNVPLSAYLTLQALNLIPGQRQADEMVKWLDPTPRRVTRSKALQYEPGVVEAMQAGGWTGLADRMARGLFTGDFSSPLPPQGRIDKKTGVVVEPREFDIRSRIAALMGQNLKPVPRREYEEALSSNE